MSHTHTFIRAKPAERKHCVASQKKVNAQGSTILVKSVPAGPAKPRSEFVVERLHRLSSLKASALLQDKEAHRRALDKNGEEDRKQLANRASAIFALVFQKPELQDFFENRKSLQEALTNLKAAGKGKGKARDDIAEAVHLARQKSFHKSGTFGDLGSSSDSVISQPNNLDIHDYAGPAAKVVLLSDAELVHVSPAPKGMVVSKSCSSIADKPSSLGVTALPSFAPGFNPNANSERSFHDQRKKDKVRDDSEITYLSPGTGAM